MAKKMRKVKGAKAPQTLVATPPTKTAPSTKLAGAAKATPEQQAQYDQMMLAARKVIYGDPKAPDGTRFQMVLQRLANAKGNLAEAIGGITAVILANVAGAAKKQGRTIPTVILVNAGREIIADLIEIAIAAKFMPKEQAAQMVPQAIAYALRAYKAGTAPPQPAQAQPAAPASAPPGPPASPGIIAAAQGA